MSDLGAILLTLALGAGPGEVVVQRGETLAEVAKRALGEDGSATELKAFNKLPADQVPEGTALKLPGPERGFAASTLKTARAAVAQAGAPQARRKEAEARLKEAETLFAAARYHEAAQAADAAWSAVSDGQAKETRFSVEVGPEGSARVRALAGAPVRVEAKGVSQPVYAGQEVTVEKGSSPPPPDAPLAPPSLAAPADGARLEGRPLKQGLGPVVLAWQPVSGASGYEVVVSPAKGPELILGAQRPELTLPPLKEGRYQWAVRAVSGGRRSEPSPRRSFELLRDLKIEAEPTPWK